MRESKEIFINGNTLEKILEDHKHWLNRDIAGWGNMYANLRGADLNSADLKYADLRGADLNSADLRGAVLKGADLSYANLSYANLRGADLRGAYLNGTNLRCVYLNRADLNGAYLRGANLRGTDLIYANLSGADLRGADLQYTDLRYVYLNGADLSNVDLNGANLNGANLSGVNLSNVDLSYVKLDKEEQIRKGVKLSNSITGWKKCKDGVIVKLEIPRGAIVFSINNNKCRTDKAIVKEIIGSDRAFSIHKYFSYYVGDKIEVYNFNCEYNIECAEGIHFFRTRKEAENYDY